jgi:peptidoglycan hydrolase-like protein with peptidoglycan-binding domain
MRLLAKTTSVTTVQDSPFEKPRVLGTPPFTPPSSPVAIQPPPSSGSPATPPPSTPAPAASTEPARSAPASREVIARAQARLNELGFAAGTADGRMGARTQDAIRKFQASKKLRPTGELDMETLAALGVR